MTKTKAIPVEEPSEENGWSPFQQYIEDNWRICSSCFSRTHELHHVYDQDKLKSSLRGVLKSEVSQTTAAQTEQLTRYDSKGSNWNEKDYPSPTQTTKGTTCLACGSVDRVNGLRPAPIDLALDYGKNLYERLEEVDGIYADEDDLLNEIRSLKKKKPIQPSDNTVFRKAVDNTVLVDHSELPGHE